MLNHSLILLLIVRLCHGYTIFNTTCTTPLDAVNFVSGADMRGTLDILWSCLFTILACTWTVLHLNVPEQREARDPGWMGDFKWGFKSFWRSTKWMLITIIAPEILLSKYWTDLNNAQIDLEKLKELAAEDEVPWTLTHGLFANMGGFVFRTHAELRLGKPADNDNSVKAHDRTELLAATPEPHAAIEMEEPGKSAVPNKSIPDICNPYHLLGEDIIALREAGLLARLPYITVEEIRDRSKSDSLIRVITLAQIIWMAIQILVRAGRHLAISQLEIAVVAFASCAVVMYGLSWSKPKGVQVPITIMQCRGDASQEILQCLTTNKQEKLATFTSWTTGIRDALGLPDPRFGRPVPNDYNRGSDADGHGDFLGLIIGSMVFGGIHLAAWNFDFPTRIEQILWWASSIYCTAFVFVLAFYAIIKDPTESLVLRHFERFIDEDILYNFWPSVIMLSYVFARVFLLVEVFRTLFFLPPDAYQSTWAINFPHVS